MPLTGLESTTPPADYEYDKVLRTAVSDFNNQAFSIEDWGTAEAAEVLRGSDVTHVYAGIRSSFFRVEELRANEGLALIYYENGVFIFEVLR